MSTVKNKRLSKRRKREYTFKGLGVAIAVILIFSIVLASIGKWEKSGKSTVAAEVSGKTDPKAIEVDGKWYMPDRNVKTFLVIGTDDFGEQKESTSYNNSKQADFLALLIVNSGKKEYAVLRLNRDTVTEINVLGVNGEPAGTVNAQLALSHTYGSGLEDSCENTVLAVENLLLGAKIDRYVSVNMSAVPIVNDAVGGVEVTIKDDFSDVDKTLKKGETVTLKGEQALNFVRARNGMSDNTNKARMTRQWDYLLKLAGNLLEANKGDESFSSGIYKKLLPYAVTNSEIDEIKTLMSELSQYDYKGTVDISGTSKTGDEYVEFYPDGDELRETVLYLMYTSK